MKTAIFPGSFDPFTIGHFDVVLRALPLFDNIIIAIGGNQNKSTLFTAEERKTMIEQAVRPYAANVTVTIYHNLTVNLCREHNARFIIRGIRTVADFDYENIVAQANYKLSPEVQSIFFPSHPELSFVCSSVVRDILLHGGDVSAFIPEGMKIVELKEISQS
jgi:pantetheine-phosphate adenylyltransferase